MRTGHRLVPGVVLTAAAAVASAAALGALSGSAIEVPGTGALNVNGAVLTSVTCAKAGFCAAGGEYTEASGGLDGSGAEQAFLVDETNGVWGTAIEVPGLAALNVEGDARLFDISCPKAGFCAAAGFYRDGDLDGHGFLVNETNGVWGNARKVPGVPAVSGGFSVADFISCTKPGWCAAAGTYDDFHENSHAFVANETSGVWHKAVKIPNAPELDAFSCTAAGFCAAGGIFAGGCPCQAWVANEIKGVWGKAKVVPGVVAFNHGPSALSTVNSISCAKSGWCTAGGYYSDNHDNEHAFVVDEKNGVWRKAIKVSGAAALGPGEVYSVSCSAPGSCAAGGSYSDASDHEHAFVVSEKGGVWLKAAKVDNLGTYGAVDSVSCTKTGACTAGGYSVDGSGAGQAFTVERKNGVWNAAVEVPGTAALNLGGDARVWSISCLGAGSCTAGGSYRDQTGVSQAFVTSP
jgi:hypothetical protein